MDARREWRRDGARTAADLAESGTLNALEIAQDAAVQKTLEGCLAGALILKRNKAAGDAFDAYVAETKLRGLDELGQLGKQERLPTPWLTKKRYVIPDFTIYRPDGLIAAYGEAKTGRMIAYDAQAQGLLEWATTTQSRTLVYYTPDGKSVIHPSLLQMARTLGVAVKQVAVP
jgi:filamentous hemagglutinin